LSLGLLGKKIGMTQIFSEEDGSVLPVTLIEAGPCLVVQKKTVKTDGYDALQLGFEDIKESKLTKPLLGHFRKSNVTPKRLLKEFRIEEGIDKYNVGQTLTVEIFKEGEFVDVTGTSKGRGFAGVIKRWDFRGGPGSHGSTRHRAPGSIGQSSFPSRVFKGMKMAGRMGNEKVTVQNLKIVKLDPSKNLLVVKGAIAGRNGGLVIVRKAKKRRV
jgi:large subunit ribosomal protein L3